MSGKESGKKREKCLLSHSSGRRFDLTYRTALLPEFTTLVYSGLNGIARECLCVRASVQDLSPYIHD